MDLGKFESEEMHIEVLFVESIGLRAKLSIYTIEIES